MRKYQEEIIKLLQVNPTIDPQKEIDKRVQFLCDFMQNGD